jgi:indole-3-glycerol phosphate synthase
MSDNNSNKSQIFIAEIKTKSPSGFVATESFHELMELAIEHGDWISVHDNALWGGDFDSISFVRRYTDKPILAKGIHGTDDSIRQAIEHGADYVLVVGRVPESEHLKKYCLYESVDDLSATNPTDKIVINQRNLRTGLLAGSLWMEDQIKTYKRTLNYNFVCQASGITKKEDIHPEVDAFIVGTHLKAFLSLKPQPTIIRPVNNPFKSGTSIAEQLFNADPNNWLNNYFNNNNDNDGEIKYEKDEAPPF